MGASSWSWILIDLGAILVGFTFGYSVGRWQVWRRAASDTEREDSDGNR